MGCEVFVGGARVGGKSGGAVSIDPGGRGSRRAEARSKDAARRELRPPAVPDALVLRRRDVSERQAAIHSSRDDGVGFDFDEGVVVDQLGDFEERGGWADFFEDFAVDSGDFFPLGDVDDEHAGADDVFDLPAE